jgi:hypothetical protein
VLTVVDLDRSQDLPEGDRSLRDPDRLVRAAFQEGIVSGTDPCEQSARS